jgi:hypothetical protein
MRLHQAVRQLAHRLVLEEQCLRQFAEILLQPRIHTHDHHRIDAVGFEPLPAVDPLRRELGHLRDDALEVALHLVPHWTARILRAPAHEGAGSARSHESSQRIGPPVQHDPPG